MANYFKKVLNDKSLVERYRQVHEYEVAHGGHAHHDYNHVVNVATYCEKILKSLNFDDEFVSEAKIAALLHDTGALQGKENHAQRSFEFAKKYLKENNIHLKNENLVLEAIKNHSDGFETDNIIQWQLHDKFCLRQKDESGRTQQLLFHEKGFQGNPIFLKQTLPNPQSLHQQQSVGRVL